MSGQKTMTLVDYLASEAAREHATLMLQDPQARDFLVGRTWFTWLAPRPSDMWRALQIDTVRVYYRPDGERYTVTDLGEGVKALRLRTGCDVPHFYKIRGSLGPGIGYGDGGEISAAYGSEAPDLPDAICRVMLASLKVAQS